MFCETCGAKNCFPITSLPSIDCTVAQPAIWTIKRDLYSPRLIGSQKAHCDSDVLWCWCALGPWQWIRKGNMVVSGCGKRAQSEFNHARCMQSSVGALCIVSFLVAKGVWSANWRSRGRGPRVFCTCRVWFLSGTLNPRPTWIWINTCAYLQILADYAEEGTSVSKTTWRK